MGKIIVSYENADFNSIFSSTCIVITKRGLIKAKELICGDEITDIAKGKPLIVKSVK